jgi:hypothetical protein
MVALLERFEDLGRIISLVPQRSDSASFTIIERADGKRAKWIRSYGSSKSSDYGLGKYGTHSWDLAGAGHFGDPLGYEIFAIGDTDIPNSAERNYLHPHYMTFFLGAETSAEKLGRLPRAPAWRSGESAGGSA